MKIIDLLNKIANGEEVPKKIKFQDDEFNYQNEIDYVCGTRYLFEEFVRITPEDLNKEIEIIENKKIKKIKSLNNVGSCQDLIELKIKQQLNNHALKDKINEIIDKINKEKK